ncbi:MAG: cupin domain-containing protein [Acetobacter sp.]|jgi:oxalate decarboxylase|nr:cupin domain-containing protein [Acetobacter sp.]MCH4060521.1 cupin domain-containing protein [Acetobacter sp.]MCH4087461.1 cupin domain-containing protein [Acetobacter sp.]MCI1294662.1 cupin domain-containing protein [Acetobacter sp.]MCI1321189.1 cupin domain-containing protein [Acetobacter sp.]
MEKLKQPIMGSRGADIVGPRNPEIESQNPDIFLPPVTDNGGIPNLKFPFAMAHNRLEDGGWAREVTCREMGALKELAIVNMRLPTGVVREMHWHKEAEWAYVLQGKVRFYLMDDQRQTLVEDLEPGDLWFAPAGFPHAIQGLEEGTEFVLVFNDGNFSENQTLLVTELFAHLPVEVLAKNFGVPEAAFANIPSHEKYIFRQPVPPPLEQVRKDLGAVSFTDKYVFRASSTPPTAYPGGATQVIDSRNFSVTTLAALIIDLEPGGMREVHWHPDADELQYYISGKARMTVFDAVNNARTFDFVPGDVGYVPRTLAHYIENIGDEPVRVINVFHTEIYKDISLNNWLALTPAHLVTGHLEVDGQLMDHLRATRQPVVKK